MTTYTTTLKPSTCLTCRRLGWMQEPVDGGDCCTARRRHESTMARRAFRAARYYDDQRDPMFNTYDD